MIKKAIEQLERISKNISSTGENVDYTDIAIQALEKQIPKKPVWKEIDLGIFTNSIHPYCECGFPLRFRHGDESPIDNFCGNCGQAIDWSND